MSRTVVGLFVDSDDQEASGSLTDLTAYVTNDLSTYTACTNAAAQEGVTGVVRVDLTDAEAAANQAVKFTSSRSDVVDCIVRYGNREEIATRSSGEDTQRCQRTGIRFPKSRIVRDGLGKEVGDKYQIRPIVERPQYIP